MRHRTMVVGIAAFALLAAACEEQPEIFVTPSPLRSPSPSPTPSIFGGGTVSPGVPASGTPSPESGRPFQNAPGVEEADAKMKAEGDGITLDLHFDQITEYPIYSPPDGAIALTWVDAKGQSLLIAANHLYEGTKKTSPAVSLQLGVVIQGEIVSFLSSDGTCSITFTSVLKHSVRGSVSCPALKAGDGTTLKVEGEFSARLQAGLA